MCEEYFVASFIKICMVAWLQIIARRRTEQAAVTWLPRSYKYKQTLRRRSLFHSSFRRSDRVSIKVQNARDFVAVHQRVPTKWTHGTRIIRRYIPLYLRISRRRTSRLESWNFVRHFIGAQPCAHDGVGFTITLFFIKIINLYIYTCLATNFTTTIFTSPDSYFIIFMIKASSGYFFNLTHFHYSLFFR